MPDRIASIRSSIGAPWHAARGRLNLRTQLVAITALLASAVAAGLVIVVQLSLAGAANSTTERVVGDRADALIDGISTASAGATLTVPRAQLDPGVAVYDDTGSEVAGTVPPSMQEEFADLSTTKETRVVEGGEHYAIMAMPFQTPTGVTGVVVMTEAMAPYERNERSALVVSVVAGALLVLMAAGSAAWISRRVLRPVEEMARTADQWSEQDLERRFALGPPTNEIRALGSTLDGLLDKVSSAIRTEQRLTSELAHELRTPLTTIHGAAELLALRTDLDAEASEDVDLIRQASASMSATITVLLDLARSQQQRHPVPRSRLAELRGDLLALARPSGRLTVDLPDTAHLDVPRELAVRALAPLVENGLRFADDVWITARVADRTVEILVADDGPGLVDKAVDRIFEPGWSGDDGSGLGLSLARRVARTGGGDVAVGSPHNERGGATFVVTFPGGQ
ncbi:MAG: HAMP domain-containing sensor histidine kinase [Nocardioides sp.]|uniref:HAMP domain-containing sensor histidine kinase n=1 Tax=Nocardioides sp. TaxID=35761 RepID=UPI0039E2E03C